MMRRRAPASPSHTAVSLTIRATRLLPVAAAIPGKTTNHSSGCDTTLTRTPSRAARPVETPTAAGNATVYTGTSTNNVSPSAAGYESSATRSLGRRALVTYTVAIAAALMLALFVPLEVAVYGVLLVGIGHLVFEVRYVLGHYAGILHGGFLVGVNLVLVVIVAGRLLWPGANAQRLEMTLVFAMLAVAAVRWVPDLRARAATVIALGLLAGFAFTHTDVWFVVQAHLHNLVPVLFLWGWSGVALRHRRHRRWFRALTLAWVLAIPALLLSGWFDGRLVDPTMSATWSTAAPAGVMGSIVPGSIAAGSAIAARLLAVFAFAQLLHYVTWCWFLPRYGGPSEPGFVASPAGRWLHGWRVVVVVGSLMAVVLGLAYVDYRQGRTFYTALGAYHAYLEFPVLIALLAGARPRYATACEPVRGLAK
jgi:hypothetical protein